MGHGKFSSDQTLFLKIETVVMNNEAFWGEPHSLLPVQHRTTDVYFTSPQLYYMSSLRLCVICPIDCDFDFHLHLCHQCRYEDEASTSEFCQQNGEAKGLQLSFGQIGGIVGSPIGSKISLAQATEKPVRRCSV